MKDLKINKNWTLFLDRDGVINKRLVDDYVKNWNQFVFIDGVFESLEILSNLFGRIIIVTNQQGIGKKIMSEKALFSIHEKMIKKIEQSNGRIDRIYYCGMLKDEINNCRKPAPVMANLAKKDFPEINFKRSVMIGDTSSDIAFGKDLGMKTIFLGNEINKHADFNFQNLLGASSEIQKKRSFYEHNK